MKIIDEQQARAHILEYPDAQLHRSSAAVDELEETTAKTAILLERMLRDLHVLGLSAPQIGVNKRMFVLKRNGKIHHLINPEIAWTHGRQTFYARCASIPGKVFKTERYAEIIVDAIGIDGQPISFLLDGEFARIVQHQIDHLNGVLLTDRGELLSQEAA